MPEIMNLRVLVLQTGRCSFGFWYLEIATALRTAHRASELFRYAFDDRSNGNSVGETNLDEMQSRLGERPAPDLIL